MLGNITKVPVEVVDNRRQPIGCFTRTVMRVQGDCTCGRRIVVETDDGNGWDCECGRIYNLNGQELRPRREWEEQMEEDE